MNSLFKVRLPETHLILTETQSKKKIKSNENQVKLHPKIKSSENQVKIHHFSGQFLEVLPMLSDKKQHITYLLIYLVFTSKYLLLFLASWITYLSSFLRLNAEQTWDGSFQRKLADFCGHGKEQCSFSTFSVSSPISAWSTI